MAGYAGLAFGVVGAAIGAPFGYAGVGFLAGSLVGNLVFPPEGPRITGPRLDDLTVSSSAEGTPRPMGWGTFPVAAQIIWATEIQEHEESVGGGKGGAIGGGSGMTTYKYTANLALGFGEPGRLSVKGGKAAGIVQLYADGKLIADIGAEAVAAGVEVASLLTNTVSKSQAIGFRWRFYNGSETQQPDPLIESVLGAGNAPAYRGEIYLVLENFPLENYGNHIPNFTAVVAYEGTRSDVNRSLVLLGANAAKLTTGVSFDLDAGYWKETVSSGVYRLHKFNISTFAETQYGPSLIRWGPGAGGDADIGNIVVSSLTGLIFANVTDGGVNGDSVCVIDPATLQIVGQFGNPDAAVTNVAPTDAAPYGKMLGAAVAVNDIIRADGLIETYGLAVGTVGYRARMLLCRLWEDGFVNLQTPEIGRIEYVWGEDSLNDALLRDSLENIATRACAGRSVPGTCDFFAGSDNGSTWTAGIYRMQVQQGARYLIYDQQYGGVFVERIVDDIGISYANGDYINSMMFDRTDQTLIVISQIGGALSGVTRWQKWDRDGNKIWDTGNIAFGPFAPSIARELKAAQSRIISQDACFVSSSDQTLHIDLATGVIEEIGTATVTGGDVYFFDTLSNSAIVENGATSDLSQFFCDRLTPGGELLANIISDTAERAGYDPLSDHDVAELIDTIPGFAFERQTEARNVPALLAPLYAFEATEADFKVKYRKIDKSLADSIAEAVIIPQDGSVRATIGETRQQDVEIPRTVDIGFVDRENQWQPGLASAKRILNPTPAVRSDNRARFDVPIALNPVEAAGMAETMLWRGWTERIFLEWKAAWEFLALIPTDIVDLTVNNAVYRTRITRMAIGADNTIEFAGVTHEVPVYTLSEIPAAAVGSAAPRQIVPGASVGYLGFLDAPLLRDQDDSSNAIPLYFGCWANPSFRAQTIYKRSAAGDYIALARCIHEATTGVTVDALPDVPVGAFFTDTTSSVTLRLLEGEDTGLVTQTDAQWRANGLAVLIGSEVVSAKTVVDNGDGTFTLSNFFRGRLGTEGATAGHAAGERWWLLDPADLHITTAPLSDKDTAQLYKTVADGQSFELAPAVSYTANAAALKPYAVAQLAAANDGSGNVNITFTPRSRYASNMRDVVDAYFESESAESYEVDIVKNGVVVRTLAATTGSVAYTAGLQTIDFGGPASLITINAYKINPIIGRGRVASISHAGPAGATATRPSIVGSVTKLAKYNTAANYESFSVTPAASAGNTILVVAIAYNASGATGASDDLRFLDMQGGSFVRFNGADMNHVPCVAQIDNSTFTGMADIFWIANPGTAAGPVEIQWPDGLIPKGFVASAFVIQDVNPTVPFGTPRGFRTIALNNFAGAPSWPNANSDDFQFNDEGAVFVQWFKETGSPTLGLMFQCQQDPRKLIAFNVPGDMTAVDFTTSTGSTTGNTEACGSRLASIPLSGEAGTTVTGGYSTQEINGVQPRISADIFLEVNGL